ncbi:uncharacterized protein BDZ83DRAFT_618472 [Colletotrichum acutatum]|uniref:Uncharacterized protein n=1 Tax=Glomerella acutata TaxID=27357 RepID=A0AAD8UKX6_GLOAC|nr:uncharacterized protein BDZ83DRAFT_618472 [Colletotrichum acutatum]KAK1725796.1 hypothetical protein BDZ83DRAFT_618472 [Colletotrichum acutatum]
MPLHLHHLMHANENIAHTLRSVILRTQTRVCAYLLQTVISRAGALRRTQGNGSFDTNRI